MKLNCRHCGYDWDYNGKADYWATCPRCLYKVNIKTAKEALIEKNIKKNKN